MHESCHTMQKESLRQKCQRELNCKIATFKDYLGFIFSREEISLVKAIFLSKKHAGIGKSAEKRDERGAKIVV